MSRRYLALAAGLIMILTLPVTGNALTFQNGSFETPGIGSGNFLNLDATPSDSNYITGWEVFTGDIDYVKAWTASDGDYSIDLNGSTAGGIRQTFDTTPGLYYEVLFDMAANPTASSMVAPPPTVTLTASTGSLTESYSFDSSLSTSYGNLGWTTYSYSFLATDALTTLEFVSTTSGLNINATGPALDNVRVNATGPAPIPEPATILLIGTGIVGFAGTRIRKRLQK